MFGFFKKAESPDAIASRVYVETLEALSTLKIIPTLAEMHKHAASGECSVSDCNDLVMGAYRTLFLAAGLARYRMAREMQDEAAGDKVSNQILNDSAIRNIVGMIRESVPFTCDDPMLTAAKEVGMLYQAATMLDRMLRLKQLDKAYEVWRTCAKGSYTELPRVYAR